jgi:hypothetical protein
VKNLYIEQTKSSPKRDFNYETNILSIVGESYPENTSSFYEPILEWLNSYLSIISEIDVVVNIDLIYFNSSSSKMLMDIFDILDNATKDGKKIVVNWMYDVDDDAIKEYGEEFAEDVDKLIFNIVEK